MKPFLYISGLFRSGTTLLQEIFTEADQSFIFHEPRFGDGGWQFEEHDRRYLRKWGWDPPKFPDIAATWKYFMEGKGIQIGVKEIRNQSGRFYYDCWGGNLRFIVVERDPAEIYISCYKMLMRNSEVFMWSPRFTPFSAVNIYRELVEEVHNINKVWDMCHPACRKVVHYGDLVCNVDSSLADLYAFTESDITKPDIGGYHAILPRGGYETKTHSKSITNNALNHVDVPSSVIEEGKRLRQLINREKSWI